MLYYKDDELTIRTMEEADDREFYEALITQGWHPQTGDWLKRIKDEVDGKCITLTAVYKGQPAGYVYVYRTVKEGPFKDKGWPIIVDFNVLKKFQRKGIGNISCICIKNLSKRSW